MPPDSNPRPSEAALEKAARMALSYLLHSGPDAYFVGDVVDALAEALKPYNEENDGAAA